MQGRYIAFCARHPSHLAPSIGVEPAMFRALKRDWRTSQHPIHERSRAPVRGAARAFNSAKPKE